MYIQLEVNIYVYVVLYTAQTGPTPNLNGIAIYPTCLLYAFNPGSNLYEDYNPRSSSYCPLRIGLLGPARRIPAGGKRCFCSFSQVLSSMSWSWTFMEHFCSGFSPASSGGKGGEGCEVTYKLHPLHRLCFPTYHPSPLDTSWPERIRAL